MGLKRFRRGQSSIEFSTLITIILAVMITIGVYFKRGVQGRWRASTDELGEQYDPAAMNSDVVFRLNAQTETRITTIPDGDDGFWTQRHDVTDSIESKSGAVRVAAP